MTAPDDDAPADGGDLAFVVRELVRDGLARVRTVGPGVVESYDATKQRATVTATVGGWRYDEDTRQLVAVEWKPVANVPVLWARGKTWSITGPLEKGDKVLLLVAERSVAEWKATGRSGSPEDLRRFDLSDAFALPTGSDFVDVLGADATHTSDLVIRADGIRIGSSAAIQFAARSDRVAAQIARLEQAHNTHTHPVTVTGAVPAGASPVAGSTTPTTSQVTPGTTAADVACDKVRIE